jgi:hypothetical protein
MPHVPVRPAPIDNDAPQEAIAEPTKPAIPTPTKKVKAPSTAPVAVIVVTLIVVLVLMGLTVAVYMQSNK